MKTCIAVHDAIDDTPLAFISAADIYARLKAAAGELESCRQDPSGTGGIGSPFIINGFPAIIGYISKRRIKKTGVMHFRFFGVDMYQYGNDTGDAQNAYYIGLADGTTLSYPDMRAQMDDAAPDPAVNPSTVKTAMGIAANNKYELLAVACLFIAEGRRDNISLVTHLLLCDLITDEVVYGSAGTKTRSLGTTVDKGKSFTARYAGVTAGGDSPMSQKNAVDHARLSNSQLGDWKKPAGNRYFDKTVSLVVQWTVNYYASNNYTLEACAAADELRLAALETTKADYIDTAIGGIVHKKGVKAAKKRTAESILKNSLTPKLHGLKNQILSDISAMLLGKIAKAKGGNSGGFTFTSTSVLDTTVLKQALGAAVG